MIYLKDIPMPPSMNHAYLTRIIHGKPIRVKTPKVRAWEKEFLAWCLCHNGPGLQITLCSSSKLIVVCDFYFKKSDIYTKSGEFKRNDVSNRIKLLHDSVADLFGFDDCQIFEGSFRKEISHTGVSYVDVSINVLDSPKS